MSRDSLLMGELIAGIDLGGTNVRIAIAKTQQPESFLYYTSAKTPVDGGPAAFLEIVRSSIRDGLRELNAPKDALSGLGCTIPGITDAQKGISLLVTNLPGWDDYPIKAELEQMLGVPVAVDNDVNSAALGEYWYGAGENVDSMVYLTISTGIAAGIVINGRLLRGANHAAGEMGFFMPDPRLLDRSWEPNGCLELTSAGVGLARSWVALKNGDAPVNATALDVFTAANQGDQQAKSVVQNGANYLAQSVIAITTIIDPEKIILSGSIVQHQQVIYERICDMTARHVPHAPEIVISSFDGDAPLIGALAMAARI